MGFLRFLPFEVTRNDRIFLAVATLIAIHLLWMRFLTDVTIWGAVVVSLVVSAAIVKWG